MMKYFKIILITIILGFTLNSYPLKIQLKSKKPKLRDYYLNATFVYRFINSENRQAIAIIYLNENRSFEYREKAGRGTTIFAGSYKITENKIIFVNDNQITRKFHYKLDEKNIILKTKNVPNNNGILFHIQPPKSNAEIKYKRVDYKKIKPAKNQVKTETYIMKTGLNLFAFVFNKNGTYTYRAVIQGKTYTVVKGKYIFNKGKLVIEDKKGRRFYFKSKANKNELILEMFSKKFLVPFKGKNKHIFKRVK